MFVPTKAFLTKGVGRHKEKLTSFEMALRDAHLATYNLVRVSSIFPPQCELLDREEGMSMLRPGQVLFTVVAESSTNEPSRLVAASIGLAMPADPTHHGYISEHHSYGQNELVAGEYAEDLAASMLGTVLGVPPRGRVGRGVRGGVRRPGRHGIRRGEPVPRLPGVARPRGRRADDRPRPVSIGRDQGAVPAARAEDRAGVQAGGLPRLGDRR